tara:strand:+ start:181 stop:1188 length:1008 start_codon:yes stop_codon:yes gene_type:complete
MLLLGIGIGVQANSGLGHPHIKLLPKFFNNFSIFFQYFFNIFHIRCAKYNHMITFAKFFLMLEAFDTVSDFLLNPEHRDKWFYELLKEFEADGGSVIGRGSKGHVYSHPKWPYVIKLFEKDDEYLKFVRYSYMNPGPNFPKFYGKPQKIVPYYKRMEESATQYITRIEKLYPLTSEEFDEFEKYENVVSRHILYSKDPTILVNHWGDDAETYFKELENEVKEIPPDIYQLFISKNMIDTVSEKEQWGVPDWHSKNVMKRKNGDLVLIDPVWEGHVFDAHRDYDQSVADLTGADGGYEERNPLQGGESPKKKRVKKKKVKVAPVEPEVYSSDDIPF